MRKKRMPLRKREQMIDEAVRQAIGTVDRQDSMSDIEIIEVLWNRPDFKDFRNSHIRDVRSEFRRIEAE